MANKERNITYIGKDFNSIKSSLEQYAKTYFSNNYNDFSESSPGNMFMEMVAYVGDILSFYTDNQIQENFIQYASQTSNVYDMAYLLGYKPKITTLSSTLIDFYQLIPAKYDGSNYTPDWDYSLLVSPFTQVSNEDGVSFLIENEINFSISSSSDPTEVTISQTTNGNPTYFLLKKTRKAISGNINKFTYSFGNYEEFPTINIPGSSIAHIIDVKDSDGNNWYEVDYLGQDLIYKSRFNVNHSDPNEDSSYILDTFNTQRRFTSRFTSPDNLQIQFGSGKSYDNDSELVPSFENVGIGLPLTSNKLTTSYSPTNFVFTDSYGIAPSNTTLTFRYITGGGIYSNVPSYSINRINNISDVSFPTPNLDSGITQYIISNFKIINPIPSTGGKSGDTIDDIKINASTNFSSQMRNVTKDDYLVRTLSMPSHFGAVAKAYAVKPNVTQDKSTLDLYILSQNSSGNLKNASLTLKENLQKYLHQYRMIGDTINIKDAYVINIGVNFEIIPLPNYNNNEVLIKCINKLKEHFNIKYWQINEPIIIKDIEIILDKIEGVQTVKKVEIINLTGEEKGYSKYEYDITGATQNRIIYPSLDPMIFELKNPDFDIKGKTSLI